MLKRAFIVLKLLFVRNPIKYVKKLGVNIGEGTEIVISPYFWSYPDFGSEPYLIEIGKNTKISSGVTFITHDGSTWCFRKQEKYKNIIRYGKINIGDNCFIGCNSTIMPNVKIGNNCIIGAGSVVTKSINDGEVWAGAPAKFINLTEKLGEKFKIETPVYDIENYNKNKKDEVIRILNQVEKDI